MRGAKTWLVGLCGAAGVLAVQGASGQTCTGGPAATRTIAGSDTGVVAIAAVPGTTRSILTLSINGRVRFIDAGTPRSTVALQIPGFGSQGAGYGLAPDPTFADSGVIYVFGPEGSASTLRRYRRSATNPEVFDPASSELVFRLAFQPSQHGSGWIGFGPDNMLYLGLGDHVQFLQNVQSRGSYAGKILRIDPRGDDFPADANRNYRIPPDNPPAASGELPEIVAMGLRNPWRCSIDAESGRMYIGDVGEGQREEVSVLPLRLPTVVNFGWPCLEGTVNGFSSGTVCRTIPASEFTPPLFDLTSTLSRCITGGVVYRGESIPALRGQYVFGTCSVPPTMYAADIERPGIVRAFLNPGAVYCVGADNAGEMYIGLPSAAVAQIVPATPPNDCNGNGFPDSCDISQGYDTDINSNGVPDACERVCRHDMDLNGVSNVNDVLTFLALWYRGAPGADFTRDAAVGVADVLEFVTAWFAGC